MDFTDALVSNLNEMMGNVTKAVIEILDARKLKQPEAKEPVKAGAGIGVKGFENAVSKAAGALSKVTDKDLDSKLDDMLNVPGMNSVIGDLDGVKKRKFYVQFNPNELTLSGCGGGLISKTDYSKSNQNNELTFEKMDVRIELKVKLIFDKADPQDAFMADKFSMSTSAVFKGVMNGIDLAKGRKEAYSVQKEVEAFVAAVRSPRTRQITFHWGNMSYSGVLNQVSTQYTMFNVIGAPVRATVDLSLVCTDSGVKGNKMGAWYDAYQNAFGAGSQSLVKGAQKAGNLVNFNL